jgi:hypothetical protein
VQTIDLERARRNAVAGIEGSSILRLKWLAAATRFEIALRRHDRALKYGFNPNQPRIPRGSPDGGQWTSEGGGAGERRVRLAGEIPTNDPPEFPKERPPTSPQRSAALKAAARLLGRIGGPIGTIIEIGSWAYKYSPLVEAYNDPPRSIEELQRAVSTPAIGYDIHHIVERAQAERDGYPRELIDSPDNLVRIPTMKHWDLNRWYQIENPRYDWQTPREYLSDKNWDERRSVGLKALVEVGVLKP